MKLKLKNHSSNNIRTLKPKAQNEKTNNDATRKRKLEAFL